MDHFMDALVLISLLLIPTRREIPSRHSCKKGGQPSWIPNVKGTANREAKEGTWDNGLRKIPLFFPRWSERKGSLARDQRHLPVLHGLPKSLYRFSSTQLRRSPLSSRRLPDRDDSVPLSLFPKRHMAETFEISNEVPWDFSRWFRVAFY